MIMPARGKTQAMCPITGTLVYCPTKWALGCVGNYCGRLIPVRDDLILSYEADFPNIYGDGEYTDALFIIFWSNINSEPNRHEYLENVLLMCDRDTGKLTGVTILDFRRNRTSSDLQTVLWFELGISLEEDILPYLPDSAR